MFPHLIGQKVSKKLNDEKLAEVIGVSRSMFSSKMKRGSFSILEAKKLSEFFNKDINYLFALESDAA